MSGTAPVLSVVVFIILVALIFDFMERATDRCEDVANVIEAVMIKHG